MSNFLLPVSDETFIMTVAKAISRERLMLDSDRVLKQSMGYGIDDDPTLRGKLEEEFEHLWNGSHKHDAEVRARFRDDALAAINAINLHLLTFPSL